MYKSTISVLHALIYEPYILGAKSLINQCQSVSTGEEKLENSGVLREAKMHLEG